MLSISTVNFHVSNILSKLGTTNRTEAASLAVKHRAWFPPTNLQNR